MTPLRRVLSIAVLALVVPLVASCGSSGSDSSSDDSGSPTSVASGDSSGDSSGGSDRSDRQQKAVDALAKGFAAGGLSDDKADCLAGAIIDEYGGDDAPTSASAVDVAKMQAALKKCGVSASDLAGAGVGGTSNETAIRAGLTGGLAALDLSEEQLKCVIDAYMDEFGDDTTALQNPGALTPLLNGCGIEAG